MKRAIQVAFGGRLRALRMERNISQEELADSAGLHRTYIGSAERGERNVSLVNLGKIATALGVPVSKLVDGLDGSVD